mgnify:CR=1 FL=1
MGFWDKTTNKYVDWSEAGSRVGQWQQSGWQVVFTNGCFDLIHLGHLHYLAQARDLGDFLVIGLNSQGSVRKLKGDHRPIKDEQTRAMLLASLQYVDLVVCFKEDTPQKLIDHLQPDILVKGGDYTIDQIVGADTVLQRGGEVLTLPFIAGYSTTALEEKIRRSAPH